MITAIFISSILLPLLGFTILRDIYILDTRNRDDLREIKDQIEALSRETTVRLSDIEYYLPDGWKKAKNMSEY